MKLQTLLIRLSLCLTLFFTFSCKKDAETPSNNASGNFTIKYEIVTSSPIFKTDFFQFNGQYINGTGQVESNTDFTNGTTWTKTVTVTESKRPFLVLLQAINFIISAPGTVTGNIYINGEKKATVTNQTISASGFNVATVIMQYTVQ